MAHFLDPSTGKGLGQLTVDKSKPFKIGLYGGGPGGEELKVTSNPNLDGKDPAIVGIEPRGASVRVFTINPSLLSGDKLYALFGTLNYSEPAQIVYGKAAAPTKRFGKEDIRESIVELARTFVAGAHYLWGTAGNTPGLSDGNPGGAKSSIAKLRDASLDERSIEQKKVLGVCMAYQDMADGYNSCAGRSLNKTANLAEYLKNAREDETKSKDQTTWRSAPGGLHPRKYHFRSGLKPGVVWGESCKDRRHFDCVGLVNYCYAYHVTHKEFALDIKAWDKPIQGVEAISSATDIMDADVVIKAEYAHIAMVYLEDGKAKLVQAEDTTYGLTEGKLYNPGDWMVRVRMLDQYLTIMKASLK